MILCGSHRLDGLAVHIRKYRHFSSGHELFYHHCIAGCTEFLVFHDGFYAVFCFFWRITDQHTFSECQSVCFQNNREICLFQICKCCGCIGKCFVSSGRNIIFFHQVFGKCLGAFQDCCILSRSEYTQSFCLKCIYDTANQRIIHTNYRKIDCLFFCKCDQFIKLHCLDRHTFCKFFNSGIARCTVNFIYFWTLCDFPCDRMLTSAASDYQYFHPASFFLYIKYLNIQCLRIFSHF